MGNWKRERTRAIDRAINGEPQALIRFPEVFESVQIVEAFNGGMGTLKDLTDFVNEFGLEKLQEYMEILQLVTDRNRKTMEGKIKVG